MNIRDLVVKNDLRLLDMASYAASKGLTEHIEEEVIRLKFIELKALIRRGSFTVDELETDIYTRYGAVCEKALDKTLNTPQADDVKFKDDMNKFLQMFNREKDGNNG